MFVVRGTHPANWILDNFVRSHFTTKKVPAVALGIIEKALSLDDIFKMQIAILRV